MSCSTITQCLCSQGQVKGKPQDSFCGCPTGLELKLLTYPQTSTTFLLISGTQTRKKEQNQLTVSLLSSPDSSAIYTSAQLGYLKLLLSKKFHRYDLVVLIKQFLEQLKAANIIGQKNPPKKLTVIKLFYR